MTSAYLPGPEHAASTSGQTGVVCAFMIQSNEIVIHVHASVASHVLGSSRGMTKSRSRRKFSKSTNFLIHQNSARVSLSLQTAVKVLPMVTSNCRHPGYKTKDPINTFWRGRLQVIERLFANMVFAHCMETTPYTL